jgi:hypothetical protein
MKINSQRIARTGVIPFLIRLCGGELPVIRETEELLVKFLSSFVETDECVA